MNSLSSLGWTESLDASWRDAQYEQYTPGRIIADYGANYKVAIPEEISAEISGRMQYICEPHELPKVGDWVAVQAIDNGQGVIHAVLPRKSEIGRKRPGEQAVQQILAVNVDLAFLVQALDHDFSLERVQRYLFQLNKEGIEPVIILNKADKEVDIQARLVELEPLGVKIITTSAVRGDGVDEIAAAIRPGATAVFLGSSGVGKSTITNALLGEDRQATKTIREVDSKGRHTTTHRELFVLPNGGMVIDTPGLREVQLWGAEDDLGSTFSDIESLSGDCQFANCSHGAEPNCAVQIALASGGLSARRFEAYQQFQSELRYLSTKLDEGVARERKQSYKKAQKQFNQIVRSKNKRKH